MESRKPQYGLVVSTKEVNPDTGKRAYTRVGVAWDVFDGEGIAIKLNPGTVLDWRMMDEYYLTIFRNRDQDHQSRQKAPPPSDQDYQGYDEDIPF